jgi:hypothetical protein
MKKVEALKKAVSDGNYTVPAEDLAPKLMESMFSKYYFGRGPKRGVGLPIGSGRPVNPQQRAAPGLTAALW